MNGCAYQTQKHRDPEQVGEPDDPGEESGDRQTPSQQASAELAAPPTPAQEGADCDDYAKDNRSENYYRQGVGLYISLSRRNHPSRAGRRRPLRDMYKESKQELDHRPGTR